MSTERIPAELFDAEHLPTIPAVAVEVLRMCRDPETTLDDLATIIAHDAALSARLLRFANSSLYNLGSEVTSLQRATLILGLKTVQLMSLTFSLATSLPRSGNQSFDYHRFWQRGLIRAVSARAIAERARTLTEDEVFLAGLLSEIGMVTLAGAMPDEYTRVIEATTDGWPTPELEREMLGFSSAEIGEALLERWEFPEIIRRATGLSQQLDALPDDLSADLRSTAQVLRMAGHVTSILTGNSAPTAIVMLEKDGQEYFGLSPEELDTLILSLEYSLRETAELLSVELPADLTAAELLREARGEYDRHDMGQPRAPGGMKTPPPVARFMSQITFIDEALEIPNRHAFDCFLAEEVARRLNGESNRPLGVLMIAVDGLADARSRNDPQAELLVRHSANTLMEFVRETDLLAAIEDGVFGIIMPDATPLGLRAVARRLRMGVESARLKHEGSEIRTTVTAGGLCLGTARAKTDGLALVNAALHYLSVAVGQRTNHCVVRRQILRASA